MEIDEPENYVDLETDHLWGMVTDEPVTKPEFIQKTNKIDSLAAELATRKPNQMCRNSKRYARCSICLLMKSPDTLRTFSMNNAKLMMLIGTILRGNYTREAANELMMRKYRDFCYLDIIEAMKEIYKALGIGPANNFFNCPMGNMKAIRTRIEAIWPEFKNWELGLILQNFMLKVKFPTQGKARRLKPNPPSNTTNISFRPCCAICNEYNETLKFVATEEQKVIILTGAVLQSKLTLQETQELYAKLPRMFICFAHFLDAITQIFSVFHVKNVDDIAMCSAKSMKKVMDIVNSINPDFMTRQLYLVLDVVFQKYKHLLN